MLLLVCGELPVLPPVGRCDPADLTIPSVVAVAAPSSDQPLVPSIQTWSAMAPGVSVVPLQVRLHTGERGSTDEHPRSLGHVGPLFAVAYAGKSTRSSSGTEPRSRPLMRQRTSNG